MSFGKKSLDNSFEGKRVFLIVSADSDRKNAISAFISNRFSQTTIYLANDGSDGISKIAHARPHVIITDLHLPKMSGVDFISAVLQSITRKNPDLSIIVTSAIPDNEMFIDDVIQGRVQFLTDNLDEKKLQVCLALALNRLAAINETSYKIRFLAPEQVLFVQGDKAESVFIVKRGKLKALKKIENSEHILGEILPGEFAGEMAHINNDVRSATVSATENSELIEIPLGVLDTVLFSKPSWAQALVKTLSRRLKLTNEALASRPDHGD
jgi:CRP/FNR family cyclic AMP-dependent transcriptional regulator